MKDKLFKEKHPLAWIVLVLSVALLVINYTREWQRSASLLDLPNILARLRQ